MPDDHSGLIYRVQPASVAQDESNARRFTLSFSSLKPVLRQRTDRETPWYEVLGHGDGDVDLGRLNSGAPVLPNHRSDGLPLGVVERAWVDRTNPDDPKGRADVLMSSRHADLVSDISEGIVPNVSVGYRYTANRPAVRSKGDGDKYETRTVSWEPFEISIASVPEDTSVGFGRSVTQPGVETMDEEKEVSNVERTAPVPAPAAVVPPPPVDIHAPDEAEIVRRALQAEQGRVSAIREIFKPYAESYRTLFDQCRDDTSVGVQEASRRLLQQIAVQNLPLGDSRAPVVGETDSEKFLRGAEEALLDRANMIEKDDKIDLKGNEFRGLSMLDLAKKALQVRNLDGGGDKMTLVARAITHSSSDFTNLMSNVANKGLMRGFNYAGETYQAWTRAGSATDFKTVTRVGLGGVSTLSTVYENGEYEHGTFAETAETGSLDTYGRILTLSRKMIINDDLNALSRLPFLMGQRSAQKVGDLAYATLTANANLSDAVALFATARGNLVTSGAAISTATVEAGRAALGNYTSGIISGDVTTVIPKYLLCAHAKLGTARATLESEHWVGTAGSAEASDQANIVRGIVTPIADRRLDANASGNPWFLTPDPNIYDFVELLYLDGRQTPVLEQETPFSTDGIAYKIRFDVAAMVLAPNAYQNDGVT